MIRVVSSLKLHLSSSNLIHVVRRSIVRAVKHSAWIKFERLFSHNDLLCKASYVRFIFAIISAALSCSSLSLP